MNAFFCGASALGWKGLSIAIADQIEKRLVDTGIVAEFRMKCCRYRHSLLNHYWIGAFGREYLNFRPYTLDLGCANKYHLDCRIPQRFGQKLAFANGALALAAVGIAPDADVNGTETGLRGIRDLACEEDRSRAGSESRFRTNELLKLFKARFAKQLEKCSRLPTRNDQAVDAIELFRFPYEHDVSAEFGEPSSMCIEITLQGENTNFHNRRRSLVFRRPRPKHKARVAAYGRLPTPIPGWFSSKLPF
jgi:hypothetical protein